MSRRRPTVEPAVEPEISEQSLRRMIHENADGMLVIDREGVVRFANPAAERLLGRQDGSLEGTQLGFPVVAGELGEIEVLAGESPRTAEMRAVMIEWDGEPALLGSLRDVTGRKRAEAISEGCWRRRRTRS